MDQLVDKSLSYETEATEGLTMQTLTLESIKKMSGSRLGSQLSADAHHYQTLAYSYDEDYKTQGPLMEKPDLRSFNSPMMISVDKDIAIREAERLCSEIVADLESEDYYVDPSSKHVPAKMNMLRRALANLEYNELEDFFSKNWESNKPYSTIKYVQAPYYPY